MDSQETFNNVFFYKLSQYFLYWCRVSKVFLVCSVCFIFNYYVLPLASCLGIFKDFPKAYCSRVQGAINSFSKASWKSVHSPMRLQKSGLQLPVGFSMTVCTVFSFDVALQSHVTFCKSVKGTVPRDFLIYFFLHQSASPGHLIHWLQAFHNCLKILRAL